MKQTANQLEIDDSADLKVSGDFPFQVCLLKKVGQNEHYGKRWESIKIPPPSPFKSRDIPSEFHIAR